MRGAGSVACCARLAGLDWLCLASCALCKAGALHAKPDKGPPSSPIVHSAGLITHDTKNNMYPSESYHDHGGGGAGLPGGPLSPPSPYTREGSRFLSFLSPWALDCEHEGREKKSGSSEIEIAQVLCSRLHALHPICSSCFLFLLLPGLLS